MMAGLKHWTLYIVASILFTCKAQLCPAPLPESGVRLFLSYKKLPLQNYSFIGANQFFDVDTNGDNVDDGVWCQSSSSINESNNLGGWYIPNGDRVSEVDDGSSLHQNIYVNQFVLLRDDSIANSDGTEGLYVCKILYNDDETSVLIVGIYGSTKYNSNDGPDVNGSIEFSMVSTNDVVPAVFSLTFNVSDGPPTQINCSVNNIIIDIPEEDIVREVLEFLEPILTRVSVHFRTGEEGRYNCTVSNSRVESGILDGTLAVVGSFQQEIHIEVAHCPTELSQVKLGFREFLITWTPPNNENFSMSGYEVFYESSTGSKQSVMVMDANNVTLTGLNIAETYVVTVVSLGANFVLPSVHCETITITTDIPQIGSSLLFSCTGSSLMLVWASPMWPTPPDHYLLSYSCSLLPRCSIQDQNSFNLYTANIIKLNTTNYTITNLIPESSCDVSVSTVYNETLDEFSVPVNTSLYVGEGFCLLMNDHKFIQCFDGSDIIEGLDVGVVNSTAVVLFWTPKVPNCCISYYTVFFCSVSEGTSMNSTKLSFTYPLKVLSGLNSGEEYHFHVSAVLTNGSEVDSLSISKLIPTITQNDTEWSNTTTSVNSIPQVSMDPTSPSFFLSVNLYIIQMLAILLFVSIILNFVTVIKLCARRKSKGAKKCKMPERKADKHKTVTNCDMELQISQDHGNIQCNPDSVHPAPEFFQENLLVDHVYSSVDPSRKDFNSRVALMDRQEDEDYEDMSVIYHPVQ